MKKKETNKEEQARLEKQRLSMVALLEEWPIERRKDDFEGYSAAIRVLNSRIECRLKELGNR